jgi:hypothetical protein
MSATQLGTYCSGGVVLRERPSIKRKWFTKIVAGVKRIEYRDIKPCWRNRLSKVRTPFKLVPRNGMSPPTHRDRPH